jgi:hypothetical protein
MSIFISRHSTLNTVAAVYDRRSELCDAHKAPLQKKLLHNLEGSALAVASGGAVQHRPDSMNGLAIAANDPPDVALAQLHLENRRFAVRNFRQYHVVGKFDQLTDDELEELLHVKNRLTANPPSLKATAGKVGTNRHDFSFGEKAPANHAKGRQ